MNLLQKTKKELVSMDMFYSTQMLRYRKDKQYSTITGGLVSLAIIVMVVAGFFSMIWQTLNRTAINSSATAIKSNNPPLYTLTADARNMFMFGLQIQSTDRTFFYDMNGPRRYFDIQVMQYTIQYGFITGQPQLPMEACNDQHWSMLPDLVDNKDKLKYSTWLCPPLGSQFTIQGGFFSNNYSEVVIKVLYCTNSSIPQRPCHSRQDIDNLFKKYGNFYFAVNYINTVINPSQTTYLSYYIESLDHIIFSAKQGAELFYLFTDYTIQSDNSIWPFTSSQTDIGCLIQNRSPSRAFTANEATGYVVVALAKAADSLYYYRQVQKISAVFSYIGGLVGAVSAVLFLIKVYTDTSLQVSIAMALFNEPHYKEDDKTGANQTINHNTLGQITAGEAKPQKVAKRRFTMIGFVKLYLYKMFKTFKFTNDWDEAKIFNEFTAEIVEHLDIKLLIRRIINLENCVSCVFDDYQMNCLKYTKKFDIQKIRNLRKMLIQESDQQLELTAGVRSQKVIYCFEGNKEQPKSIKSNCQNQLFPPRVDEAPSEYSHQSRIDIILPKVKRPRKPSQSQHQPQSRSQPQHHLPAQPYPSLEDHETYTGRGNSKTMWITRKTMKSFKRLKKLKDENYISRKIWENANDEIKKQVSNVDDQEDFNMPDERPQQRRSHVRPVLPSIMSIENI